MIACAMDGIDGLRGDGWCMERIDEDKWAMIMPKGVGAGRRHGRIC